MDYDNDIGKLEMDVEFPKSHHYCSFCPFILYNIGLHRSTCTITGEIVPWTDKNRGKKCPIKFEEDDLV